MHMVVCCTSEIIFNEKVLLCNVVPKHAYEHWKRMKEWEKWESNVYNVCLFLRVFTFHY